MKNDKKFKYMYKWSLWGVEKIYAEKYFKRQWVRIMKNCLETSKYERQIKQEKKNQKRNKYKENYT